MDTYIHAQRDTIIASLKPQYQQENGRQISLDSLIILVIFFTIRHILQTIIRVWIEEIRAERDVRIVTNRQCVNAMSIA